MNRRQFSKTFGVGALALFTLPGMAMDTARVPLGLCNHSLRDMHLNVRQLLDFAIKHSLDSILINTFEPFESLDPGHLSDLRRHAEAHGVSIHVGVGSISERSSSFSAKYGSAEDLLHEGIRVAGQLGSSVVACRIGSMEDRFSEGGIESHMEEVSGIMRRAGDRARDAGIKFAFENHCGDLRSSELITLIRSTGGEICGALFDPANAVWAMEDPMKALEVLGSVIVSTSVRDVAVWESEEGATFQGMAIGEGILDVEAFKQMLAGNCPGVPIHVETISNSARSVDFLAPGFWQAFPDLSASEFMGFLQLVKAGKPEEIKLPPAGITQKDFDISLQQSELLQSLEYLRS